MEVKLSKRLCSIATYCEFYKGSCFLDIGADHAKLLIYLACKSILKKGIISELNLGPYLNSKRQIEKFKLQNFIDVRLGDGFLVLKEEDFLAGLDIVIIAGLGGKLITEILSKGKEAFPSKLHNITFILQPNEGEAILRNWLKKNYFFLLTEDLVKERNLFYDIIVVKGGKEKESLYKDSFLPEALLLEIGPYLWNLRHPLLREKILFLLKKKEQKVNFLNVALKKVKNSSLEKIELLTEDLKKEISFLKNALNFI